MDEVNFLLEMKLDMKIYQAFLSAFLLLQAKVDGPSYHGVLLLGIKQHLVTEGKILSYGEEEETCTDLKKQYVWIAGNQCLALG